MTDLINRPAHYTRHAIECVEVSERLSSALAQAWQYLWRADENGTPDLDRGKAIWWLRRERQRLLFSYEAVPATDEAPPFGMSKVTSCFDPLTGQALGCIWRLAWDGGEIADVNHGKACDLIDLAIRLIEMRLADDARARA